MENSSDGKLELSVFEEELDERTILCEIDINIKSKRAHLFQVLRTSSCNIKVEESVKFLEEILHKCSLQVNDVLEANEISERS